jgi:putative ABC transport system permease protein
MQFLVEAVVMAATGIIGILLGIGSSELLKFWAQWPTLVSRLSLPLPFFSRRRGRLLWFLSRPKAANLDPIDALRYE